MPAFAVRKGTQSDDQPLSARLWAGIDDIYAAILAHPFIAGLTDGSLEREAFRFYWEVGKTLLRRGSPDPLYRRCIETYGGEEFAAVVQAVLALADRLGPPSYGSRALDGRAAWVARGYETKAPMPTR